MHLFRSLLLLWVSSPIAFASSFQHGVASGDPLSDRVILWTRITPDPDKSGPISYSWFLYEDQAPQTVVASGSGSTGAERDFTVKIDATGLKPHTRYSYGFRTEASESPLGHTQTLPEEAAPLAQLRLLFASCSNYPYGFFHGYREIAKETNVDAVLHLGDYLYEYKDDEYGDGAPLHRVPSPDHDLITLQDYRMRHAQYKSDPDLQAAHAAHPFIVVWDDHEVANDAWMGGAENHHTPEQGSWSLRRNAAVQAYHEWMPTRDTEGLSPLKSYKSFTFGKLASLAILDTRIVGRDQQLKVGDPKINDSTRQLLGPEQEAWLRDELARAQKLDTSWQIIGQQIMLSPLKSRGRITNPDQWDGYPAARQRLFEALEATQRKRTLILAGDIHSSWASQLTEALVKGKGNSQNVLAVELVTPGITSPSIENQSQAQLTAKALQFENPHFAFADLYHRGYARLDLTAESATVRWILLDGVRNSDYHIVPGPSFRIPAEKLGLIPLQD